MRLRSGAVDTVLKGDFDGDVLLVGHEAVGTLMWCALSDVLISRRYDQTRGGSVFGFDLFVRQPFAGVHLMEDWI